MARPQAQAEHDRCPPPEGAPQRACSKRDVPRRIGRTKGGLNPKLHAVCDESGRLIILLLSEGPMSDHMGARLVLEVLSTGSTLIADRGYDSNWFREALADKDITPCIPATESRKVPIAHEKALYRQRHKVEMV
jgi:transposase